MPSIRTAKEARKNSLVRSERCRKEAEELVESKVLPALDVLIGVCDCYCLSLCEGSVPHMSLNDAYSRNALVNALTALGYRVSLIPEKVEGEKWIENPFSKDVKDRFRKQLVPSGRYQEIVIKWE